MDAIPHVDALVREYLLFRGFTKALHAFDADHAADRGCGFQAEQISNLLFGRLVAQHDGEGLIALLESIQTLIVSRMSGELEESAPRLEARKLQPLSVLRLYIVHAIESGKPDHVRQFFADHGERLSRGTQAEAWAKWFALPFLQKPQAHPDFQVYFTKPWRQLVEASFRNFLAKAIAELPLPAILRFSADRKQRLALQRKVENLQAELDVLRGLTKAQSPSKHAISDSKGSNTNVAQIESPEGASKLGVNASPTATAQTLGRQSSRLSSDAQTDKAQRTGSMSVGRQPVTSSAEAALASISADGQLAAQPVGSSVRAQEMTDQAKPADTTPPAGSYETSVLLSDTSDGEADDSLEEAAPKIDWPETEEQRGVGLGPQVTTSASGASLTSSAKAESLGHAVGQGDEIRSIVGQQEDLQGHEAAITDVIFAPDGRNVASASTDGVVRIWAPDLLNGNQERAAVLLCGSPVKRLAWDTRADKIMLMGTAGKGVKAWHLDTKRMVAHMRPDPAFPVIADIACSPADPSFLCATATGDGRSAEGRLSIWNLRAFRKTQTFRGETRLDSVCFDPDGRSVAATGADGKLHLFDASTAGPTLSLDLQCKRDGPSFVRFLEARGRRVLTLSPDGVLRAWDVAMTRGPTWKMDVSTACAPSGSHPHRFAPAPGGGCREAACTSASGLSHVISGLFGTDAKIASAAAHQGLVPAVAWHPTKRMIVTGSSDRTLKLTCLLSSDR